MYRRLKSNQQRWQQFKEKLQQQNRLYYSVVDFVETIVVALVLALIIRQWVIMTSVVPTGSMMPTLMAYEERTYRNERLFVNKFIYRFREPRRGEIVVFKSPRGDNKEYVKRLIGLPGDHLRMEKGNIYVNDRLLVIAGVNVQHDRYSFDPLVIPAKSYFMMGDNRGNSADSRFWPLEGNSPYVPREHILGKAWFTFWPFNRMRVLR